MKAVRLHGPGDLRVDDIPAPVTGPKDSLVRPSVVGICGSDVSYTAHGGVTEALKSPIGLGHEVAGVIQTVGSEVSNLKVGQRIVVNPMGDGNATGNGAPEGASSSLMIVRNATAGGGVLPLPEALSFEDGALVEPLASRRMPSIGPR